MKERKEIKRNAVGNGRKVKLLLFRKLCFVLTLLSMLMSGESVAFENTRNMLPEGPVAFQADGHSNANLNLFSGPAITCTGSTVCNNAATGTASVAVDASSLFLKITSPASHQFSVALASFGPDVITHPLIGDIVYYSNPDPGCTPYPAGTFNGKLALIDRGTCFFENKVYHAQLAGAVGVIIVNNVPGPPVTMGSANVYAISIPVVMISNTDGAIIKNLIASPAVVAANTTVYAYQWSNGSITPAISGLTSGSYTVSVTADGGPASVCTVEVFNNIPDPVNVTLTGDSIFCQGDFVELFADKINVAEEFNGVNQWINLNADITNLNDASFTIETWIKTTGSGEGIVMSGNTNSVWETGERAFFIDSIGRPSFSGYGNGYINGSLAINDGNWHHIAVVWEYSAPSGSGIIYIDGVNRTLSSTYVSNAFANTGAFSIARPNFNAAEAPDYFSGDLDEVRIWNIARTAGQIQAGMLSQVSPVETGLLAYYQFEETSFLVLNTASPLFNGTPVNNPDKVYAYTYQWLPAGGTAPYLSVSSTGSYSVIVVDYFGCPVTSSPVFVKVHPQPDTPVIGSDSSLYFCSGDSLLLYADTTNSILDIRYGNTVISYSSQFSGSAGSAQKILGAPDVYPAYGNQANSWSGQTPDGQRELIQLSFAAPSPVNFIDIYETNHAGAVDTVYVRNPHSGLFEVVYVAAASPQPANARKLHIAFPLTQFNVAEIRIALNSPAISGMNEIDAVAIGHELNYLWSTGATTSSIKVATGGLYTLLAGNGYCESGAAVVQVNELPAPVMWYADADMDAFGNAMVSFSSCHQPAGFVSDNTDCNDLSSSVFPSAPEICNGIDDNCNTLTDDNCSGASLHMKAFLEGFYNGSGGMVPVLQNAGITAPPFACDTLYIELRNPLSPASILAAASAVVSTSGQASFTLPGSIAGQSAYICVRHRNAVQTWSNVVPFTTITAYDFTTSAAQAYGANQREVAPGVWAFYSGDLSPQDEFIDLLDQGVIDNHIFNFENGYVVSDLSGDGYVDLVDQAIADNNIFNFIGSIHP